MSGRSSCGSLQAQDLQKLRTPLQKVMKTTQLQQQRHQKLLQETRKEKMKGDVIAGRCHVIVVTVALAAVTIPIAAALHGATGIKDLPVAGLEFSHLHKYVMSENVNDRGKENVNCEKKIDVDEMKF